MDREMYGIRMYGVKSTKNQWKVKKERRLDVT